MARRRDPTEFLDQFSAVRKRVTALAMQTYAVEGVGSTQAGLLRYIGAHGPTSQAELARATASDPALTGRVLQTLIQRGLVKRERSADDRRVYVLDLTPGGRRARERIEKLRGEVAKRIVASLDERDVDDFARIARKILASL